MEMKSLLFNLLFVQVTLDAFRGRRLLNLVYVLLLLILKGTSQFSCDGARPDVSFFILSLSLKNMTRSTPQNCLLSNPLIPSSSNTEYGIQKWFMHIKQVYFVLS